MQYSEVVSTKKTPQSEPIPGKPMVENNAGGMLDVVGFDTSVPTIINDFIME